jgi:hypothetical protein
MKLYLLKVSIRVVPPLDPRQLEDQPLGLHGEHQYMNAGLAVALANTWLERQGHLDRIHVKDHVSTPNCLVLLPRAQINWVQPYTMSSTSLLLSCVN